MKYKFNEQELLSLFYDEYTPYPILSTPFYKDGYIIATEKHILIRIKKDKDIKEEYKKDVGKINLSIPKENCNFIIKIEQIENVLSKINKNIDEYCTIRIRDVNIRFDFLEILYNAMLIIGIDYIRCVHQSLKEPCVFRVDKNIEILIMPNKLNSNYCINGIG